MVKADIGGKGGTFKDTFWVTSGEGGGKVAEQDIPAMAAALEALLASYAKPSASVRPKLSVPGASEDRQELLHTLMDTYVKNDVLSIQQSIVNREWMQGAATAAAAAGAAAGSAVAAAATTRGRQPAPSSSHTPPIACPRF